MATVNWTAVRSSMMLIAVSGLIVLAPAVLLGTAAAESRAPSDHKLAGVALVRDHGTDVQEKLGPPCVVPSANGETVSYLYQAGDGRYLRFIVNVAPSDVYYGLVESMTMTVANIVPAACYRSIGVATNSRPVASSHSGKGITLGDSLQDVLQTYGQPNTIPDDGPKRQLRYESGLDGDHYTEWILSFHNERLVEWTVRSLPFFIEVGS